MHLRSKTQRNIKLIVIFLCTYFRYFISFSLFFIRCHLSSYTIINWHRDFISSPQFQQLLQPLSIENADVSLLQLYGGIIYAVKLLLPNNITLTILLLLSYCPRQPLLSTQEIPLIEFSIPNILVILVCLNVNKFI